MKILSRELWSRVATVAALGSLALATGSFLLMWAMAFAQGAVPDGPWWEYDANHGPWRHRYELRGLWWLVLKLLVFALGSGAVAFILKPGVRRLAVLAAPLLLAAAFIWTQYWLVD